MRVWVITANRDPPAAIAKPQEAGAGREGGVQEPSLAPHLHLDHTLDKGEDEMAGTAAVEQVRACADLIHFRARQLTPGSPSLPEQAAQLDHSSAGNDGRETDWSTSFMVVCGGASAAGREAAASVAAALRVQAIHADTNECAGSEPEAPEADALAAKAKLSDSGGMPLAAALALVEACLADGHTPPAGARHKQLPAGSALQHAVAQLAAALRSYVATSPPATDLVCVLDLAAQGKDSALSPAAVLQALLVDVLRDATVDIGHVPAAATAVLHLHMPAGDAPCMLAEPLQLPFRFTGSQDWFTAHTPTWRRLLAPLHAAHVREGKPIRALELGCWEGRSSVWLLLNLLSSAAAPSPPAGSRLVCVDHFDLLRTAAGRARREALAHNVRLTGLAHLCSIRAEFTVPALTALLQEGAQFDFVYIDASHERADVLLDAVLAWRCVAAGGLVIFDDYCWPNYERRSAQHPAEGIDAFVAAHRHELEVVHSEYQLAVRRTAPAWRGFEWASAPEETLDAAVAPDGAVWKGRM